MKSKLFKEYGQEFERFFKNDLPENDPFWKNMALHMYEGFVEGSIEYFKEVANILNDYLDMYVEHDVSEQRSTLFLDLSNLISFVDAMRVVSDHVESEPIKMEARITSGMLERWAICSTSEVSYSDDQTESTALFNKIKAKCKGHPTDTQSHYEFGLLARRLNYLFLANQNVLFVRRYRLTWFTGNPPQARSFIAWLRATKPEKYKEVILTLTEDKSYGKFWIDINQSLEDFDKEHTMRSVMNASSSSVPSVTLSEDEKASIQRDVQYLTGVSSDENEYAEDRLKTLFDIVHEHNPSIVTDTVQLKLKLLEKQTKVKPTGANQAVAGMSGETENKSFKMVCIGLVFASKRSNLVKAGLLTYLAPLASAMDFQNNETNVFEVANREKIFEGYPDDFQYRLYYILIASKHNRKLQVALSQWLESSSSIAVEFRGGYVRWLLNPLNAEFRKEKEPDAFAFNLVLLFMHQTDDIYGRILIFLSENKGIKDRFVKLLIALHSLDYFYRVVIDHLRHDDVVGVDPTHMKTLRKAFKDVYWPMLFEQGKKNEETLKLRDNVVRQIMDLAHDAEVKDNINSAISAGISSSELSMILLDHFMNKPSVTAKDLKKIAGPLNPVLLETLLLKPCEQKDLSRKIAGLVTLGVSGNQLALSLMASIKDGWVAQNADVLMMMPVIRRDWDSMSLSSKVTFLMCVPALDDVNNIYAEMFSSPKIKFYDDLRDEVNTQLCVDLLSRHPIFIANTLTVNTQPNAEKWADILVLDKCPKAFIVRCYPHMSDALKSKVFKKRANAQKFVAEIIKECVSNNYFGPLPDSARTGFVQMCLEQGLFSTVKIDNDASKIIEYGFKHHILTGADEAKMKCLSAKNKKVFADYVKQNEPAKPEPKAQPDPIPETPKPVVSPWPARAPVSTRAPLLTNRIYRANVEDRLVDTLTHWTPFCSSPKNHKN